MFSIQIRKSCEQATVLRRMVTDTIDIEKWRVLYFTIENVEPCATGIPQGLLSLKMGFLNIKTGSQCM